LFLSFGERGAHLVEIKRVRNGWIAKELRSGPCGEECLRSWKVKEIMR